MIKVLEKAIEKIRELPQERQAAAAEVLEMIAAQRNQELTPDEIAGIRQAQRQVRAGKYASDQKVKSFFARFRA